MSDDYSDWDIVPEQKNSSKQLSTSSAPDDLSDWQVVSPAPNSQQQNTNESKGIAAIKAPFRIGEDVYNKGWDILKNIPNYYHATKEGIPSAINALSENPGSALRQGGAGIAEMGHNIFNTPHDIANYISQRLHLLSPETNRKIQMARQPESTVNDINEFFGKPQNKGEEAIRFAGRNAVNALGLGKAALTLNPLQLTNKGISKKVINELNNQVKSHSNMYNKLWRQADKQGFNHVPFDSGSLSQDLNILKKSYTPKQYESINNLLSSPTLENAQKAQSDLGVLRRVIEEKSKKTPLLEGEKNIHDVLSRAEKNVEGNMFKNKNGDLHNGLAKKYRKITNSYRENVVPYKYNSDIQDYLSKDITAKQLIQRLNQGPFAAKKGGFLNHPQFGIRNALLPTFGTLGAIGGSKYLYDQAFGNRLPNE